MVSLETEITRCKSEKETEKVLFEASIAKLERENADLKLSLSGKDEELVGQKAFNEKFRDEIGRLIGIIHERETVIDDNAKTLIS